jgi:hypothetical protein
LLREQEKKESILEKKITKIVEMQEEKLMQRR